ncbi:hypothetical protein Ami103574_06395 [Aminipila butyrica]|uniref:Glycosyltransferase RgtA/B/C/D-like domain-containing protein n=1 Tax=Aminipila butyrica TaxID=433296 RepID=A0A858BSU2_9FIRM|nr:hypothetical protein [Aminipila butyrica]QIB68973.1 hypothetical protein Ami103574_06395 [Aminipila butyrica]
MLVIWDLLLGISLILSFFGYMMLAKESLALKQEFIPVFVFSSVSCMVYFFGLAGFLLPGAIVILACGLLMFGFILFRKIRAGEKVPFSISLFKLAFLIGSVFFFQLLLQCKLVHYDNFSHWAIVLKQMLTTNAFPTAASNLIDFKNYPLGISSFLYYVCRFAGTSQPMMLFSQGLLIFSCFYAIFGIISEKKRFLLYAFLGLGCSTLSFFNITIRISNLLVDFLLPIFTLAIFAAAYHYRRDMKRACLVILPLGGLLSVTKSTGVIFAGIGLTFLTYLWFVHRKPGWWKDGLLLLTTMAGAFLPRLGWSWRMTTFFQGIENKFNVSASELTGKTPEQMQEIVGLFLKSIADVSTRTTIGVLLFHVAAIAASIFAVYVLKKKWNLWKALIALDVVLVLYYAGILGLYLYSMPLEEALGLAGFERYACSIVVLFAGGLVMCATVDIERSFHYRIGQVPDDQAFKSVRNKRRYQQGVLVCMAIAVTLLMSEYNGVLYIARSYDTSLPCKVRAVTGDRWYQDGKEDQHRYLIYGSDQDQQVTNFYMQYVARYFLYAAQVDGICLFYEDNMDNLLSGYDYLVVVERDSDETRLLKKHYGVTGEEGIYQVLKSGNKVQLVLQPKE